MGKDFRSAARCFQEKNWSTFIRYRAEEMKTLSHYIFGNKEGQQKYIDSFNPVILAGGENRRFGDVSKPVQTIQGVPAILRVINQLIETGYREKDIYVVTYLGPDYEDEPYRIEPFCFFEMGPGINMEVNNVTFHKPLEIADIIKRFAVGRVEQAHMVEDGIWTFAEKWPKLKKNLLILGSDNAFHTSAPVRWFTETAGKTLNDDGKDYCIFEMIRTTSNKEDVEKMETAQVEKAEEIISEKEREAEVLFPYFGKDVYPVETRTMEKYEYEDDILWGRKEQKTLGGYNYNELLREKSTVGRLPKVPLPRFEEERGTCAYAFDREAYKKLKIPEGADVETSVCGELDKKGKGGVWPESAMHFINMNDTVLYNALLLMEASDKFIFIDRRVRSKKEIEDKKMWQRLLRMLQSPQEDEYD